MKTRVGILGVTGYAGQELLRILLRHPSVSVQHLASRRLKEPAPIGKLLPSFSQFHSLKVHPFQWKEAVDRCEILFLALPHGEAMKLAPQFLRRKGDLRIIDFSGDFRLKSTALFSDAYGMKHASTHLLQEAVYGLPELNRNAIVGSRLIANPGCYPTAILLAVAPLAKAGLLGAEGFIADAKSGVSGAGRSLKEELLFCEVNEDLRAYKVNGHQHVPEMEQELQQLTGRKTPVTFVPHLVPLNRGLYATVYVRLKRRFTENQLQKLYRQQYEKEPFVRILPEGVWPQVKSVAGTNDCEIGLRLDTKRGWAILLSAIDNLGKGAAGQAVQNMNLLLDLPETTGLSADQA